MLLAFQPAAGDCEAIGTGLAGQPVNAITSLAFVLVGVGLLLAGARGGSRSAPVFAVAVVGIGIGSAIFHGPMPTWSPFVHDLPILVVLVVIAAHAGVRAGTWGSRAGFVIIAAGSLVGGGVLAVAPDTGVPAAAVAAVGAGVIETIAHRRRLGRERRRALVAYTVVAVLVVPAAVANLLGRSGGPLCSPDSVLQLHAAWHLATALALGVYGWEILLRRDEGTS